MKRCTMKRWAMRRDGSGGLARRRGAVLLLVLVTLAAATLLLLGTVTTTWRNVRGARAALMATQVDMATELAMATRVAAMADDSVRNVPLGERVARYWVEADGLTRRAEWVRTDPFVAWLTTRVADPRLPTDRAPRTARQRALSLHPPDLPVSAAVVSTGTVDSSQAPHLRGSLAIDSTGCAGQPSASVPAVRDYTQAPTGPPDRVRDQARIDAAWPLLQARSASWVSAVAASPATDVRWRAWRVPTVDSVLVGPVHVTGLLLHDGPLRLMGDIAVHGVLLVRGRLDATAAHLVVRGSLVLDAPTAVAALGPAIVQWDRCAVEMALATVATPASGPWFVWRAVTP